MSENLGLHILCAAKQLLSLFSRYRLSVAASVAKLVHRLERFSLQLLSERFLQPPLAIVVSVHLSPASVAQLGSVLLEHIGNLCGLLFCDAPRVELPKVLELRFGYSFV